MATWNSNCYKKMCVIRWRFVEPLPPYAREDDVRRRVLGWCDVHDQPAGRSVGQPADNRLSFAGVRPVVFVRISLYVYSTHYTKCDIIINTSIYTANIVTRNVWGEVCRAFSAIDHHLQYNRHEVNGSPLYHMHICVMIFTCAYVIFDRDLPCQRKPVI